MFSNAISGYVAALFLKGLFFLYHQLKTIFPVSTGYIFCRDSNTTQQSKKPLYYFFNANKASGERSFIFPECSEKERPKCCLYTILSNANKQKNELI